MVRTARPAALLAAALLAIGLLAVAPAAVLGETIYIADMSGDQEVPGPGDPDGLGYAELRIDPAGGQVCAYISVVDIEEPLAAHIHAGAEGVEGAVVVTLPTPAGGEVDDCVSGFDEATLQAIVDDPAGYYVNVHTADFQAGAVRGQLGALDVAPVTFKKFICAPEIQSADDLEAAGPQACAQVVIEPVEPPAGYTWANEPFVFPEMAITLSDELGDLTLDDTEPGDGGHTCDPDTLTCQFAAPGRTWPIVVDGQVDVSQDTVPSGYRFGWAEVFGSSTKDPAVTQELFEDGVSFDLDTAVFASGVAVHLYDFAGAAPIEPVSLFIRKYACPESITSPEELEAAGGSDACRPAVGPGRVPPPPEGLLYDPEPLEFDMQLSIVAGELVLDIGDAVSGGDSSCDDDTMTCTANGTYAYLDDLGILAGPTTVTETSFPAGYRFGWAALQDIGKGEPPEQFVDPDSATIAFETAPGTALLLEIFDIAGSQPTPPPGPTITPPATTTVGEPARTTADLGPALLVLGWATAASLILIRRRSR